MEGSTEHLQLSARKCALISALLVRCLYCLFAATRCCLKVCNALLPSSTCLASAFPLSGPRLYPDFAKPWPILAQAHAIRERDTHDRPTPGTMIIDDSSTIKGKTPSEARSVQSFYRFTCRNWLIKLDPGRFRLNMLSIYTVPDLIQLKFRRVVIIIIVVTGFFLPLCTYSWPWPIGKQST